jgi:hypothetical protein
MYKYDAIDRQLINERVDQFRDQVRRWKAGELTTSFARCACRMACISSAMRRCSASPCLTG